MFEGGQQRSTTKWTGVLTRRLSCWASTAQGVIPKVVKAQAWCCPVCSLVQALSWENTKRVRAGKMIQSWSCSVPTGTPSVVLNWQPTASAFPKETRHPVRASKAFGVPAGRHQQGITDDCCNRESPLSTQWTKLVTPKTHHSETSRERIV